MNTLNRLGYSKNTKLLIIHADDAGLIKSQNHAIISALKFGIVNSFSIMVPCDGFVEIAEFSKKNRDVDAGIHLTTTCEWDFSRFGPVLQPGQVPTLVDRSGFFYKTIDEFKKKATAHDVEKELRAQINKAIEFGIRPTHLDTHMFSLATRRDLIRVYFTLGKEYDIPILMTNHFLHFLISEFGNTVIKDNIICNTPYMASFKDYEESGLEAYYDRVLDNLEPGLNVLLVHPANDDDEIQNMMRGRINFGVKWRQMDLNYFTSERCVARIRNNKIILINWGKIKMIKNLS